MTVPPEAQPTSAEAGLADGATRVLKNTAFRTVADLGSKIASLGLYVVMARELGPSQYGVFTFVMTLVVLVSLASRMGQPTVLTREIARDYGRVHSHFINTLCIQALSALPVLALVVVLAPAFGMDRLTQQVTALLGVAVVLESMIASLFSVMQAHERMAYVPVVLIFQRWLIAGVGVAALLLGTDVVGVSAIYLGGTILAFILGMYLLSRHVVRPRREITPRTWWPLMRMALPVGVANIFSTVLFRVDIAILAAFQSDRVVGTYGAAYRVFEGTLFLSWAVAAAVFPAFSRLKVGSEPPLRLVYDRALKLGLALTLPLGVGAMVLAGPIVDLLYGDEYREAARALALLGPAIALFSIPYVGAELLVAQDRQREVLYISAFLTVQNVGMNVILIPIMSLDGAALTTSVTEIIATALYLWRANVLVEGSEGRRVWSGPVLCTLVSGAVMYALKDHLAAAVAVGIVVYFGSLIAFERLVFPDDARLIGRILLGRLTGRGAAAAER